MAKMFTQSEYQLYIDRKEIQLDKNDFSVQETSTYRKNGSKKVKEIEFSDDFPKMQFHN